jgi:outer membrane protein TolC
MLTARTEFDEGHPLLALANAELARAEASQTLADDSSRGRPSLSIGPHRQRDPLGTFYSNSMQMTFNMPLGGRNYGSAARAQAARVVAEAQAQRSALLRELDLALHEAEHELFVVEESLDVAVERADLANRQLTMAETAFAQGEFDLRTLLRTQESTRIADSELAGLQIQRLRMIALLNHALGEIP